MRLTAPALLFASILFLGGCAKTTTTATTTPGATATVTLKDGSSFTGAVTSSDTTAISLQSATGESRTYPMAQVAGVRYGDPVPPAPAPLAARATQPATSSSAPRNNPPPAPRPMNPSRAPVAAYRTIPSGAALRIRNNEAINSETAAAGQTYTATVAQDVLDTEGGVAIPKGSDALLIVRQADGQGKLQGRSELVLDMDSVTVAGRRYQLETGDIVERGKEGVGVNKRTAIFAGGGSALGGIIGAVAGGGKGAAIGALAGAGAGTATQAVTRGRAVHVASETILTFTLEAPVRIREVR